MITETLGMRDESKGGARKKLELALTLAGFRPNSYKIKSSKKDKESRKKDDNDLWETYDYDFVVEFKGDKGVFTNNEKGKK